MQLGDLEGTAEKEYDAIAPRGGCEEDPAYSIVNFRLTPTQKRVLTEAIVLGLLGFYTLGVVATNETSPVKWMTDYMEAREKWSAEMERLRPYMKPY